MRNELETIKTTPCICMNTGRRIGCKDCVQPIVDRDYKTSNCNHIPMHIDSVLKRIKTKIDKQIATIKKNIECKCGETLKVPKNARKLHCVKCKSKWFKPYNKAWEYTKPNLIPCICGNNIPIKYQSKQEKCYKCNNYHNLINGKWERQGFTIKQDTMTIGDLTFKVRRVK